MWARCRQRVLINLSSLYSEWGELGPSTELFGACDSVGYKSIKLSGTCFPGVPTAPWQMKDGCIQKHSQEVFGCH